MPIQNSDLQLFLSGGAGNSDPNASLGGIISSTQVSATPLHNLFDKVSGSESAAGDTEYRCFYIKNNHGSLAWKDVKVWIESEVVSGASVEIGIDPAGIGDGSTTGVAGTSADESTAPSPTVTFTAAAVSEATAIQPTGGSPSAADVPFSKAFAVWIKRIVPSSTGAQAADGVTLRLSGDSDA